MTASPPADPRRLAQTPDETSDRTSDQTGTETEHNRLEMGLDSETGSEIGPERSEQIAARRAAVKARKAGRVTDDDSAADDDTATDGGTDGDSTDGDSTDGGLSPAEARRVAISATRAEAEAALKARQEARALAETRKAERELAQAEAEANKQDAIANAAPPVYRARFKRRHYMIITSFIFIVLLPSALVGWYLWERAVDQFASNVGFSVRTEEQGSAIEGLFGVSELSGSSSSDTDILYEFLQGQQLVATVDAKLDLREMWSRPGTAQDPIFVYDAPGTIEDLIAHWGKKVKIYYDSTSGLIDLRVLAFDPDEAKAIAEEIYDESSAMINQLSAIAREDGIGYAREELDEAEDRLKSARLEIQAFRNRTQLVDPAMQTQTQSGLIGALETELANAQIDLQLLSDTARDSDPRISQTERRIQAIEKQIASERSELGIEGGDSSASVADIVGQYEALAVDLQFAQEAYTAARAAYDSARNEARRKSRYLAAHVPPTRAETALYPDRTGIFTMTTLFLFLAWAFLMLAAYALRDRR